MGIIDDSGNEKSFPAGEIAKAASEMRGYMLISLHCAGSGHSGGSLSCADIVATLYLRAMRHKPTDQSGEIGRAHV